MKETLRVLISEEEIQTKVNELAVELSNKFAGKTVVLICILKGSVMFAVDLFKKIEIPVQIDFLTASSYGDATSSSGSVKIDQDITLPIEDKDVIIIEDIIDSGRTMCSIIEHLKKRNPASLTLCTLLDKPERREFEVAVDYTLFNIPNEFVVGYGLDYAQRYRNLPYVGVLSLGEE